MKFRLSGEYGELLPVRNNVPHHGIDIAMPEGTTLRAITDGVVDRVYDGSGAIGKGLSIKLDDGSRAIYGHLNEVDVKVGEQVDAGDIVGLSGNTGNSTGPHLHFGMKDADGSWLDPTPIAEQVAAMQGGSNGLMDWWNGLGDKVIGAQVDFILKPIGNALVDAAKYVCDVLTDVMPEIGFAITIVCAIGMMLSGNIPKWVARWFVGVGGAIVWLLNA